MGAKHSLDFVGVSCELYDAGNEMAPGFLDRFRNNQLWEESQLWVNSKGTILLHEDQLIAHADPGEQEGTLVLTDDIFVFEFQTIGEATTDHNAFGYMAQLSIDRGLIETYENYLKQLIGMVLYQREQVPELWRVMVNVYSFVTLWDYYEESHYTEDGTESDEYWQLLGIVDMNRAKEITTILDGVEPFES